MNSHRISIQAPEVAFSIPLLDNEFDPAEEEIFDHSELSCLHEGYHMEEEFIV
jgi:hypothetical protein